MTKRVRELIDEVVWSTDNSKGVHTQMDTIIGENVVPMVLSKLAFKSLHDWAEEQAKIHDGKASKLSTSITQMLLNQIDCTGVKNLRDHHVRISSRYDTAKLNIWLWWRT